MLLSSLRWKLKRFTSNYLAQTAEDHPIRLSYVFLRQSILIRLIWKYLTSFSEEWRDINTYIRKGGRFAKCKVSVKTNKVININHKFGDDGFFNLLKKAAQKEIFYYTPIQNRVFIVNNSLTSGGAERQILYTIEGLQKSELEIIFVGENLHSAGGFDFYLSQIVATGAKAMSLPRVSQPGKLIYQNVTPEIAAILSKMPPEIMLDILDMVSLLIRDRPATLHLWQDETNVKYGLAGIIAGVPRIILSTRNLNPSHFSYNQTYFREGYLALISEPNITMSANSYIGAKSYADWLKVPKLHIEVIHNGMPSNLWKPPSVTARKDVFKQLGWTENASLILGVFRLSPEKNPILWLNVCAKIKEIRPEIKFLCVGQGLMKSAIYAQAKALKLGNNFKHLSSSKQIANLMTASDLFLLTSAQEGTPNVILEAQFYGIPIVTTNAGGVSEILAPHRDTHLTQSDDPSVLAKTVLAALDMKSERASRKKICQAYLQKYFSNYKMCTSTRKLYNF